MKKTIFILVVAAAVLVSGCSKKTKDFVYLGQLYGTFGHAAQEKIKGNVKELKQNHFWASEENGKIVKGKPVTTEDRKTTPLGNDMTEEYSPSGIVLRSTSFDENGKILQDVKVEAEGKMVIKSSYIYNDTVIGYGKYKYEGEKPALLTGYEAKTDSVMMSMAYEYDQNGNITKTQAFNNKNEPGGYTLWSRDEKGNLLGFKSFNKDGKPTSQYDYTYDDKGNRIGHHQQDFAIGRVIDYTFKYEYDKMGNYTAIIFCKDGKPFIYRTREIKYYDL